MRQIFLLLGIRIRALSAALLQRGKNKANGIGAMILLCVLFGIVFVSFGFSFFSILFVMRSAAAQAGTDPSLYLSFAAAMTLVICLFGSTLTAQSELYQAKDTDFLLAMPLRPSAIFSSRLLLLILLNLLYGGVVILPAFLVFCLYDFSVVGLCAFLFFFTLILFAALAISCLLGWLIALLSSRAKRKNLVTILFSLAFLVLYFVGVSSMGTIVEQMEANILGFTNAVSVYLLIFTPVAQAVLGTGVVGPVVFAAVCLCFIAIVAAVLIRSYIAILTANRGGVQYTYRERKAKAASAFFALVRRELYGFVGSPGYLINAGLGLIMAPIAAIFLLASRADIALLATHPTLAPLFPILPALAAGASVFLAATVTISAPAISLEAKTLWMLKTMPLSAKTVLLAKVAFHALISAPFFLLFSVICAIALPTGPLEFLGLLLLPQATSLFCAFFGMTVGFLFPKFDWTTPTAAVKSGASVGITLFGMMLLGLVCPTLIAVAPIFLMLPAWLAPLLLTIALLGGSFGFYAYLSSRAAARRFMRLQN